MPRANRTFLTGYVWHITHRCHQREFLLRARQDRRCWLRWLLEARMRHELCVLNYIVTNNHVHLLVRDRGQGEIARSLQLVAGRTGQEYNRRKGRAGAFWQDRYHATAVATDRHFAACMTYIDLNMVRAGTVAHPCEWPESGYCEIQRLPQRYRIVDVPALQALMSCTGPCEVRDLLRRRVDEALSAGTELRREPAWTEALAVGSPAFLSQFKKALWPRAQRRRLRSADEFDVLA